MSVVDVASGASTPSIASAGERWVKSQFKRQKRPGVGVSRHLPLSVTVAAALVIGVVERIWYLQHDPINSDESIVGIFARHLAAGHANAFLPGEPVGVEPYVVAAMFKAFGTSWLTLVLPVVVLNAATCLMVWRIGRHLVRRRAIAAVAAAAMWAAPQSLVWNSTLEYGFRAVTLVCGVAMLLLALRITQGDASFVDAPLLGLVAGVAWWSSPEAVYFAVPVILWLLAWAWRTRRAWTTYWRIGATVVGACLGALPWLWDNVGAGFPSLAVSHYDAPPHSLPYATRLSIFVHYVFPIVLDVRVPRTGAFDVPAPLAVAVAVAGGLVVVASAVWCLIERTQGAALGCAVLLYPFILALAAVSIEWQSARYTNFLVPLAVLLVAVGADKLVGLGRVARRTSLGPGASAGLATALAGVLALSVVAFGTWGSINAPANAHLRPGAPNAPAQQLVAALERHHLAAGYADYWVAYKLDFLSDGRLSLTDAPPSPDRLPAMLATTLATPADRQAWIFVAPTLTARTEYSPTAIIQGPSGLPEGTFIADLHRLDIASHVLHLAGAEVVVCSRPVTPAEVGL